MCIVPMNVLIIFIEHVSSDIIDLIFVWDMCVICLSMGMFGLYGGASMCSGSSALHLLAGMYEGQH